MAESKLDQLRQQQALIQDKIKQEESRIKDRERKRDTRRKVITGGIILEYALTDDTIGPLLEPLIRQHIQTRDKNLFPDYFSDEEITQAEADAKAARQVKAKSE